MAGPTICAGCGLAGHTMGHCPEVEAGDEIDLALDRIEEKFDRLGELVAELVALDN
jgi:hypothetical protein